MGFISDRETYTIGNNIHTANNIHVVIIDTL